MTLGEVFAEAARRDISLEGRQLPLGDAPFRYSELVKGREFEVKLTASNDPDAYISCAIQDDGVEETKNFLRVNFLAMVFKAAIAGMKRKKGKPNEAAAPWVAKVFEYCQAHKITPEALLIFHKQNKLRPGRDPDYPNHSPQTENS